MEDSMALQSHLADLVEQHRALERTIQEEMSRPYADDLMVSELKKRKLRIKEEIERLRTDTALVH
jgi:hypothetical protein